MKPRILSAGLSEALENIVQYRTPFLNNEDIRAICKQVLNEDGEGRFGFYYFDVLPQVDKVFDFVAQAKKELESNPADTVAGNELVYRNEDMVLNWITAILEPEFVVDLSQQNGNAAPQRDLMIVLPSSSTKSFKDCSSTINTLNTGDVKIDFTLLHMDRLEYYIEQGGIFYIHACRPPNIIYSRNDEDLLQVPSEKVNELVEKALFVMKQGYQKSRAFLQGAYYYLEGAYYNMAAFMVHQSAELLLRNLVLGLTGGVDGRHHSIKKLMQYCCRYAPSLYHSLDKKVRMDDGMLLLMDAAYLDVRYKNDFSISGEELRQQVAWVKRLQKEAHSYIKEIANSWKD